ncbi:MAG: hypothetical protein Q4B59_04320, partial [Lachnospiraceae bacterium]|nr:hypothetical protein [Lachnospiraceae bacterium]
MQIETERFKVKGKEKHIEKPFRPCFVPMCTRKHIAWKGFIICRIYLSAVWGGSAGYPPAAFCMP